MISLPPPPPQSFLCSVALLSPHYNLRSGKSYFEQCFQLCDKLGEGSFGEVFKVQSREDGMMYAVKKSRQHFKGTQDRRQKLAEVERHEHLSHHPNCVKFHKAWEERDKLYIQTELCQMRYIRNKMGREDFSL